MNKDKSVRPAGNPARPHRQVDGPADSENHSPEPCAANRTSSSRPLSPRRRRVRRTVMTLASCALLSVVAGVIIYFRTRPEKYQPGEQTAELTSSLARGIPEEAPRPRFSDVTARAGLSSFRTFNGLRSSQLPEDMGPGVAWGDFNNDGFDDVFLVSAGGPLGGDIDQLAPCELYENAGDGTFRPVSGFPETRLRGMAAAWGDYDEDGFLDLIVTGYDSLLLFRNESGTGRFTRDDPLPNVKGFWAGASWGDYDNDRDLDLYVCGYVQYVPGTADRESMSQQVGYAVPYTLNPASYAAATNLFFRNRGGGDFEEIGAALGLGNPAGRSLGALWHDFDDDGWLDLYVANDVSDNVFYRNEAGTFREISHAAWVADHRSAMGLAAGDFDRDGDDDLFITHWVAQENALYENLWANFARAAIRSNELVSATGNSSTSVRAVLRFTDIADMKGLGQSSLPFVGWGTEFVDIDADGWLDLVAANGNTLEIPGTVPRKLQPQEMFLYWNRRAEHFHDLAPLSPGLSEKHVSRGLAISDFDNDGAMDILISDLGEGVRLLRNEMQTSNWLKLRLRSRTSKGHSAGFGDGATVIATVNGVALRRSVSSASYLSQSSRTLHFGLGPAEQVEKLEIRWRGGPTNTFANFAANATWEITEGASEIVRFQPRRSDASITTKMASPPASGMIDKSAAPDSIVRDDRARIVEFWSKQRAAMNALKVADDLPAAIQLFREALALNPAHEDSRYYLGNCLARQGDVAGALAQLEELTRINPQSHRAFQQAGTLRAIFARSRTELEAAEQSLLKARAINLEETGALLVLGEVSLLRGEFELARQRLTDACRTNPRAAGGFFLRAYLAWRQGHHDIAKSLLAQTRQALGKEWQPAGTTAEGDVRRKQHMELTPLTRFLESWNGDEDPAGAFATLDSYLNQYHAGLR